MIRIAKIFNGSKNKVSYYEELQYETVTLNGGATDVWVFQIAGKLDLASAAKVKLTGGALAKNVYFVVADTTTLGTTSVFNGNILDKTNIALNTGATLNGRALAQTAVTLDANPVTKSI